MKNYIKEFGYYLLAGFLFWYCWIIITDSISIRQGVTEAIERCLNVLIPSLFAFMAVSGIIVRSGLYITISRPFGVIAKVLLGMPKELFSIFAVSNAAGYPIGAKLLCELKDNKCIDSRTASTMLCFCFGAGPAFVSATIGLAVFGSTRAAMVIVLSCVVTNAVLAAVMCRIFKPRVTAAERKPVLGADILTDPVISAGKSLAQICLLVVFFSTLMSVLSHYSILAGISSFFGIPNGETIISSMLEISCICKLENATYAYIPVLCAICSFGGLCVLLQIIVIVGGRFSLKPFLLTRPIASMMSMLNSIWLSKLILPKDIQAFSNTERIFVKVNNFVPSVCLILMIFLLKLKKGVAFSK